MYRAPYVQIISLISALLISATSLADHYSYNQSSNISAGIDFERLSINPAIANRELIGQTASAFNLGFDIGEHHSRKPYINFGAGLSFVYFDDYGEFTQETVDDYGHLFYAESDAQALHAYIEAGPNVPLSRYTNIDFNAGYTLPISSDRSISNCSACFSEDIDIDAGFYGEIGLHHKIGQYSLKSSYKHYLDDNNGIEDSLSIGIHVRY